MTDHATGRQAAQTNAATGSGRTTDPTAQTSLRVPATIDSPQAKLVYVYLSQQGEATVDALATALDLRKLGLFDVLATLESRGLVERDGVNTVRITT